MKQALREYFTDTRFHKLMSAIAIPIILQLLLTNGLSLVDTMMIGRLGESEVAAVGLANQMFFLAFLVFFGINSGTGIFVAQFWGDKDYTGIHHVVGLAMVGTMIFAIPFAVASLAFPEALMRIFTPDENVVILGAQYLRIVAPSYILSGISGVYSMGLRSVENPRIPLLVTAISLGMNTVLNLFLIFGMLFFPAMGVRGAATATMISRSVECIIMLSLTFGRKTPIAATFREYLGFDRAMIVSFLTTAGPVFLNEVGWSLGMVMYKIVFARMGTAVVAAANVTEAIQDLFFIVIIGSGNTAAVIIGKKIGEGKAQEGKKYARHFQVQSLLSGFCMTILMIAIAPLVASLLSMKASTIILVRHSLIALAFLLPVKSFTLHMITGILRSGGDTKFALFTELFGVWCVGVPSAFLAGLVFKWTLPEVYLFVSTEEVLKCSITAQRFHSGKWLNDLRRTKDSAEKSTSTAT